MLTVFTIIRNSMKIPTDHKIILAIRMLVVGLIVILAVIVTTSFIWIQSDQVIAPPSLRMMNWLWRVFICQCSDMSATFS
jgi:hypothetical protein